jgi:hypothetical protein
MMKCEQCGKALSQTEITRNPHLYVRAKSDGGNIQYQRSLCERCDLAEKSKGVTEGKSE